MRVIFVLIYIIQRDPIAEVKSFKSNDQIKKLRSRKLNNIQGNFRFKNKEKSYYNKVKRINS